MVCDKNNSASKAFIIIVILLAPILTSSVYLIIRLLNNSPVDFTKSTATWLPIGDYCKGVERMKLGI